VRLEVVATVLPFAFAAVMLLRAIIRLLLALHLRWMLRQAREADAKLRQAIVDALEENDVRLWKELRRP
jgi:signal transduction histidine kinase